MTDMLQAITAFGIAIVIPAAIAWHLGEIARAVLALARRIIR